MQENGEDVPVPLSERTYSGKFNLRLGEKLHRELEHVLVGKHRRVPVREVTRIVGSDLGLTWEQDRSLWLHRALMTPLMTSPDEVLDRARGNVERWRAMHRSYGMTVRYLDAWERILDGGLEAVSTLSSQLHLRRASCVRTRPCRCLG